MADIITTHRVVLGQLIELEGLAVADVGCGAGALTRWMREQGASVIGLDCSVPALEAAREADPGRGGDYVLGVGEDLPLEDGSRDLIVYSYSFHHVPMDRMEEALGEAHRVLMPGGRLVSIEPRAHGSGYSLNRLVHDEAVVRTEAQARLDRAAEMGFSEVEGAEYFTEYVYSSFEDWADDLTGDDPERLASLAAVRDHCEVEFHRLATVRGDMFVFPQPNVVRVFTN